MGVVYYVACSTCKKYKELGKSRWLDNPFNGRLFDFLDNHKGDCTLHYFNDNEASHIEDDVLWGDYEEEVDDEQ